MARQKIDFTDPEKALIRKLEKDLDVINNEILSSILKDVPVEDGHVHEAFISANEDVLLPVDEATTSTLLKYDSKRSLDPKAQKAGVGKFVKLKKGYRLRITVKLPFAAKMDSGGTITVGEGGRNRGYKVGGVSTAGELYAPRRSSGPMGFLRWVDTSGQVRFARSRTLTRNIGFMSKALSLGHLMATSLGWRKSK